MRFLTSDKKAQAAAETLRRYCSERGCNNTCIFYSKYSGICKLKVKAPENFPANTKSISRL